MKHIILEASNTNFGGGFVLLEQILKYCDTNALHITVYIGYPAIYNALISRNYQYVTLIKTNTVSTLFRYCLKREQVLYFCNLPPFVKNRKSVLFAHNILFFRKPAYDKVQSLLFNIKIFVYYFWIRLFADRVSRVACQTEDVRSTLLANLNVKAELFPFYTTFVPFELKKQYDFCYVSSAPPHKNHLLLLKAISILAEVKTFNVVLTIADRPENKLILDEIDAINKRFSREVVVNAGYVTNEEVLKLYASSRALVYPSLDETIALPLIEAVQSGITVLTADRPYSYQVIEGPVLFDPLDPKSIADTMSDFLDGRYEGMKQDIKVANRLPELMACLVE